MTAELDDVSRETLDRLRIYEALLKKWNPAINLVSRNSLENAWDRHFRDSAQIFALAPVLAAAAGFPGWLSRRWRRSDRPF